MRILVRASRPRLPVSTAAAGVLLSMTAAVSLAGGAFVASQIVGELAAGVVVAFYEATVGLVLLAALYAPDLRRIGRVSRAGLGWSLLVGVGLAIGIGSFYPALGQAPLSVVAPITGAAPLVSYAFILVFLRGQERLTRGTVLGAALVVGGVVLIGVTNT